MHIVLDRPEVMNAISGSPGGTRDQLLDALTSAEADDGVRCIVLRAAGGNFSGGGDLTGNAPRTSEAEDRAFLEAAERFHARLRSARVPTVAAVQGYCLGAGLSLAVSCDLVIAADDASFGFPEGRLGLVGASAIVEQVGSQWATFLQITGELIDANTACRLGLVLTVEPADALLDRVSDLARRIARMPAEAVQVNRQTIRSIVDAGGGAASRAAALDGDTIGLGAAARAEAPDGRRFRDILAAEGMAGMKAARAMQYDRPWLNR
jgi:enoyl-CoA hydratase/carnithine racemase